MAAAVPLRSDFDAEAVRTLAKGSRDPAQIRRLLALSAIYAGGALSEAAAIGEAGLQTVRNWVLAFNAVRILVEQGPMPAARGAVRWRLVNLVQILWEEHGVSVSEQTLSRVLRAMGYRKLSARPRHHAHDPEASSSRSCERFSLRRSQIAAAVWSGST